MERNTRISRDIKMIKIVEKYSPKAKNSYDQVWRRKSCKSMFQCPEGCAGTGSGLKDVKQMFTGLKQEKDVQQAWTAL